MAQSPITLVEQAIIEICFSEEAARILALPFNLIITLPSFALMDNVEVRCSVQGSVNPVVLSMSSMSQEEHKFC
jgi:hypothetical protein